MLDLDYRNIPKKLFQKFVDPYYIEEEVLCLPHPPLLQVLSLMRLAPSLSLPSQGRKITLTNLINLITLNWITLTSHYTLSFVPFSPREWAKLTYFTLKMYIKNCLQWWVLNHPSKLFNLFIFFTHIDHSVAQIFLCQHHILAGLLLILPLDQCLLRTSILIHCLSTCLPPCCQGSLSLPGPMFASSPQHGSFLARQRLLAACLKMFASSSTTPINPACRVWGPVCQSASC